MPANPTSPPPPTPPSNRTVGKSVGALVLGALSLVYILNPTAGFDFIPDFIPGVGNLDEAAATIILMNCLAYFGLDLRALMGRKSKDPVADAKNVTPPGGYGR